MQATREAAAREKAMQEQAEREKKAREEAKVAKIEESLEFYMHKKILQLYFNLYEKNDT